MIRTTIKIDEEVFKELRKQAIDERISFTKLVNRVLDRFIKEQEPQEEKNPGLDFLEKVSRVNMKGGPRDFAKNHDKYTWE